MECKNIEQCHANKFCESDEDVIPTHGNRVGFSFKKIGNSQKYLHVGN